MPNVTTPRGFQLGKLAPVESPFKQFYTYFDKNPGPAPKQAHWGGRVTVPWQMDGNGPDPNVTIAPAGWPGCGDCVEAGKAHSLVNANFDEYGHKVAAPSANAVVEEYCAYQRCTPAELFDDPTQYDNGEAITTSLVRWSKTEEYGCKLAFTAPVDYTNLNDVKNGIYLGGGLLIGIEVPANIETEFPNEWTWTPNSPIIGGHCIWLCGYTPSYVALVSWGQLIHATWEFITHTMDEAHVVILPQAVAAGKSPTGLNIAQWEADLKELK